MSSQVALRWTARLVPCLLTPMAAAALLAACGGDDDASPQNPATATLAVLSTTDLHFNIRSCD